MKTVKSTKQQIEERAPGGTRRSASRQFDVSMVSESRDDDRGNFTIQNETTIAELKLKALARWENEGGALLLESFGSVSEKAQRFTELYYEKNKCSEFSHFGLCDDRRSVTTPAGWDLLLIRRR